MSEDDLHLQVRIAKIEDVGAQFLLAVFGLCGHIYWDGNTDGVRATEKVAALRYVADAIERRSAKEPTP